jgi:hypothetical protein
MVKITKQVAPPEEHPLRDAVVEASGDEEMLFADGFDDAIIGYFHRCGQDPVVMYDREKCISILINCGLSEEDAEEHFEFNVVGGWVGNRTPAFLIRVPEDRS